MSTLGERVAAAREAKGWTQADLATAIGMTQQGVAAIENGKSERPKKLRELARSLGVTEEHLLAEDESADRAAIQAPAIIEPERERTKGQPINFVPGADVVIPGRRQMLPVYSGAMGGNGKLVISSDFVDHVEMPAALAGVKGAYGLIVDGSSMVPEFWEGDVAWVNPHLKPARGRNHIFFHTPPGGEDAEAIIKRLNGWNDREWDLEQWNPALQFKESRKIWPICHRVVGKYEAP
jgi:transcriptional regulator with XRE-family HTH domain